MKRLKWHARWVVPVIAAGGELVSWYYGGSAGVEAWRWLLDTLAPVAQ